MNTKGFIGLLGLLLTVAIIGWVVYYMLTQYYGRPLPIDQNTEEAARDAGMDISSQMAILDGVTSTVEGIKARQVRQSQDILKSIRASEGR